MNDALLSNSLQFASGGVGPLVTMWAKTRGNLDVQGGGGDQLDAALPQHAQSRTSRRSRTSPTRTRSRCPRSRCRSRRSRCRWRPRRRSAKASRTKLDPLTVTMSHPDGQVALLSGQSEINAHFSSPPFQYQQLQKPGIHTVLNSYDVLGGPATFNVVWTTSKFRNENPKLYDAFVKALDEATALINRDKQRGGRSLPAHVEGQGQRRRHPGDAERPGDRLHDHAAERDEVRRLHGQGRRDQGASPIRGRTCSFRTRSVCREADRARPADERFARHRRRSRG